MSFSQALIFWLYVAYMVKVLFYDTRPRAVSKTSAADGFEPVNRKIVDLAARQL